MPGRSGSVPVGHPTGEVVVARDERPDPGHHEGIDRNPPGCSPGRPPRGPRPGSLPRRPPMTPSETVWTPGVHVAARVGRANRVVRTTVRALRFEAVDLSDPQQRKAFHAPFRSCPGSRERRGIGDWVRRSSARTGNRSGMTTRRPSRTEGRGCALVHFHPAPSGLSSPPLRSGSCEPTSSATPARGARPRAKRAR